MKYAWIDEQRKAYPLSAMCATLAVSASGYQVWKRGGTPNRKRLTDAQMLVLIVPSIPNSKGSMARPGWWRKFEIADFQRARSAWST